MSDDEKSEQPESPFPFLFGLGKPPTLMEVRQHVAIMSEIMEGLAEQ